MYNFYRLTKRFKHCFNPSNRSNLKYNRLSEFVDLGEAYQRVKKFATENQFFDLPRDEQMSAVAFILIVERGPVESSLKDCIAEDAIMKALDQMESKIETDDTKRD